MKAAGAASSPLHDVFAGLDLAGREPFAHLLQELRITGAVVVENDEALHADAALQYLGHEQRKAIFAIRQFGGVVLRDQAAQRNARLGVEQWQHGVEHGTADILEIHIDAIGTDGGELCGQIGRTVIEAGIEAELIDDVITFRLPPGDADHAAPVQPGNLADDSTDRATGGRHHHGFAGLRLADVEQPHIGREARHAEDAQRQRRPGEIAQLVHAGAVGEGVVLPAVEA